MDVLVVALLLMAAPDRCARSLDDYDLTTFFQGLLLAKIRSPTEIHRLRHSLTRESMNERLGIAGCGAIGSGLARAAAPHGDVLVWARSGESAARAADATGVRVTTDIGELADCTMVVEAVAEDRLVKE